MLLVPCWHPPVDGCSVPQPHCVGAPGDSLIPRGSDRGLPSPPGSPSGHAMGAAGVYYVMVTALLSIALGKRQSKTLKYW